MFHCAKLTRFPPHQTFVCDMEQKKNFSSGQIKPRAQISPEMLAYCYYIIINEISVF